MSLTHPRARVAALSRSRTADDPELIAARRELREQRLAAIITKTVSEAPPLTEEQCARLTTLLLHSPDPATGSASGGDAA